MLPEEQGNDEIGSLKRGLKGGKDCGTMEERSSRADLGFVGVLEHPRNVSIASFLASWPHGVEFHAE